jgi:hypothetical protein
MQVLYQALRGPRTSWPYVLRMHGVDESIDAFDQAVREVCPQGCHSILEGRKFSSTLLMLVDNELGESFVVDADMIVQFRGNSRNQRQQLERLEVVHHFAWDRAGLPRARRARSHKSGCVIFACGTPVKEIVTQATARKVCHLII